MKIHAQHIDAYVMPFSLSQPKDTNCHIFISAIRSLLVTITLEKGMIHALEAFENHLSFLLPKPHPE